MPPALSNSTLFTRMRLIMVIGICAVPVVGFMLTRLLMIVETVRSGNSFVAANAARLQSIARVLLALGAGKARAICTLDAVCAALQCRPGDLLEFAAASPADANKATASPCILLPRTKARMAGRFLSGHDIDGSANAAGQCGTNKSDKEPFQ